MSDYSSSQGNDKEPESGASLPLYHQVYLTLRDQILAGDIRSGSVLPSEHSLATSFNVSRVTIRRALKLLTKDLLVERRQGVGTRVTPNSYRPEQISNLGNVTIGYAEIDGIQRFPTYSSEIIPTPRQLERTFNPHKYLQKIVRLRSRSNIVYSIATFYIPLHVVELLGEGLNQEQPVLVAMFKAGIVISHAEHAINATSATDYHAKLLNIPIGSPLLYMTATFVNDAGEKVLRNEGYFRPEYYEYRGTLYRTVTEDGIRWGNLP